MFDSYSTYLVSQFFIPTPPLEYAFVYLPPHRFAPCASDRVRCPPRAFAVFPRISAMSICLTWFVLFSSVPCPCLSYLTMDISACAPCLLQNPSYIHEGNTNLYSTPVRYSFSRIFDFHASTQSHRAHTHAQVNSRASAADAVRETQNQRRIVSGGAVPPSSSSSHSLAANGADGAAYVIFAASILCSAYVV